MEIQNVNSPGARLSRETTSVQDVYDGALHTCDCCGWVWAELVRTAYAEKAGLSEVLAALFDLIGQFSDLIKDGPALSHEFTDLPFGIHHGGMVPAAELLTDLRQ